MIWLDACLDTYDHSLRLEFKENRVVGHLD